MTIRRSSPSTRTTTSGLPSTSGSSSASSSRSPACSSSIGSSGIGERPPASWLLLGISLTLFGAAILVSRLVAGWVGWVALLAGLLSVATGIDVGYSGLDSGFGDAVGLVFAVAVLIFAIGLATGGRPARRTKPT